MKPKDFDVHLAFGLVDLVVRLKADHLRVFIDTLVIGSQDVVLRCSEETFERNLVIRGTSSVQYDIRAADPDKNFRTYNVIPIFQVMRAELEKRGIHAGEPRP